MVDRNLLREFNVSEDELDQTFADALREMHRELLEMPVASSSEISG